MNARFVAVFGFVIYVNCIAEARSFQAWSRDELFKASDLVANIEFVSSRVTKDLYSGYSYGHDLTDFEAHETVFRILVPFKGGFSTGQTVTVLHFTDKPVPWVNGPRFANLIPDPLQNKKAQKNKELTENGLPVWLAFLKKRKDGRYEPVTDSYDTADSFITSYRVSMPVVKETPSEIDKLLLAPTRPYQTNVPFHE